MSTKNPLVNRKHIQEYLAWGFCAALSYIVFVLIFLSRSKYENLYLVYIGNFIFAAILGVFTYTLSYRKYEGKRSTSMLIAGQLALTCGIVFSVILNILCVLAFHPALFSQVPTSNLLPDSPDTLPLHRPAGLIFMLEANTILVSGAAASFLIVVFSYAIKRNQTKDKPTSLEKFIGGRK